VCGVEGGEMVWTGPSGTKRGGQNRGQQNKGCMLPLSALIE
jgi:hypothetical protein